MRALPVLRSLTVVLAGAAWLRVTNPAAFRAAWVEAVELNATTAQVQREQGEMRHPADTATVGEWGEAGTG